VLIVIVHPGVEEFFSALPFGVASEEPGLNKEPVVVLATVAGHNDRGRRERLHGCQGTVKVAAVVLDVKLGEQAVDRHHEVVARA
jgi:CRISPR/Cas system-associated endonuclease Cas3-HD